MSEYLSVPKAFETEINRSYSIRSGPLSELVEAIKNYTTNKKHGGQIHLDLLNTVNLRRTQLLNDFDNTHGQSEASYPTQE